MEEKPWFERATGWPAVVTLAFVGGVVAWANGLREFVDETLPGIGDVLLGLARILVSLRTEVWIGALAALIAFVAVLVHRYRQQARIGAKALEQLIEVAERSQDKLVLRATREHAVPLLAALRGQRRLSRAEIAEHRKHVVWLYEMLGGEVSSIMRRVGDAISGQD